MQTPLQILIDKLKVQASDTSGFYTTGEITLINHVIRHATELLEKERKVIEKAYVAGGLDGVFIGLANGNARAFEGMSDYFTKTFTGKND